MPGHAEWESAECSINSLDIYLNRMIRYLHECSLRERGNENPWMDDPSQPQP
jgi:hypothetical protein